MDRLPRYPAYPDATALEGRWLDLARSAGGRARTAGLSVEGRPIHRLEFGAAGGAPVLLTGLVHGIEWVGSLALLDLVRSLTSGPASGLLRHARLVVLPIVNPDALHFNGRRLAAGRIAWRRCNARGVDLNRNFPRMTRRMPLHPFAGSRLRLSPHYVGPHPFSEPETRAVRDVAQEVRPAVSVGFHSFGELLLFPWAFTARANPRQRRYQCTGEAFSAALPRARYQVLQAMRFYPTVGDLDDWLDAEFGTLAFTVEVGRPAASWRSLRRLLDPFAWMNPAAPDQAAADLTPGVGALLGAALAA